MIPKDFQLNSASRIVELFNSGHSRVLLADEVGLGKTIVARAIVERMHEQADGKPFKVIYVCSNQSIIQQNAHKLGIDVVPLSESRLSMQHKTLYQKQKKDYLIPITPATSLAQTNGYGNANERVLIYSLILHRFDPSEQESLRWYLDVYGDQKKGLHTQCFGSNRIKDIEQGFPEGYYEYIQRELDERSEFSDIIKGLKVELNNVKPDRKYINILRTLFSEISMEMLHPNLVIMDEFQRYSDLMKGADKTEENLLAQRLFNADSKPKILLVSATPYKPMVTMEEISRTERNEQFEDFHHLMRFLMDKDYGAFESKWKRYSNLLGSLSADMFDELITAKNEVEKDLRKVMVRTERYVPNLASYDEKIMVMPTVEEAKEYRLLRELLSDAAKDLGRKSPSLNIDYVKSGPFLLSFMQQYVEKDFVERAYKNKRGPKKREGLLVKKERIEKRLDLNCHNARLHALYERLFQPDKNAANLLWVPASMPYYKPTGIFEKCSDFSKILVFSRWGFVPRMLATVLSYNAARRFTPAKENKGGDYNALNKYKELLLSPFPSLARMFEKGARCEDLKEVRKRIKGAVKEKLIRVKSYASKKCGYKDLLNILNQIDNEVNIAATDLTIDDKTLDLIVNIIIASPGVCLWRCFGKDYGETYEECRKSFIWDFAEAFVDMLGNDESQGIIKKNTKSGRVFERVIDYCMQGNLWAVFDEYAFVMGYDSRMGEKDKKVLWEKMKSSIINRSPIDIDTDESFWVANGKKTSIRRWFACDYAKLTTDDKQERRKLSVQSAFNSPFRPFVLASTSIGQEGLDFHLYCRKIVHWNLPTNPVDLEQRSGRIDRYECLAIRRSVAHVFSDILNWEDAFKEARNKWRESSTHYNDLVPYWCLPKEVIERSQDIERIDNIFLLYPLSLDTELYYKLIKQLFLYRLTMGQPDQESIIELLERLGIGEDDDNKKEKLMFHLSPVCPSTK